MTTIVTVHGTFANHIDDAGDQWWQIGSPFQTQVSARVNADPKDIKWVPFHWSGENSETDRRSGGEALFEFLEENFEDKGIPYHIVGHSHGGSVIAEALRWSAHRHKKLENLRSWITVATPFLAFKKQKWLFSQFKRRYQLLIAIMIAYTLAVLSAIPSGMCSDSTSHVKGCWVEKNGDDYSRLADIQKIMPALSNQENSAWFTFAPKEMVSAGAGINIYTVGNEEWRFQTRMDDGRTVTAGFDLKFKLEEEPATIASGRGARRGTENAEPNNLFRLLLGDTAGIDYDLTPNIKKMTLYKRTSPSVIALDYCAPENIDFFDLTEGQIYPAIKGGIYNQGEQEIFSNLGNFLLACETVRAANPENRDAYEKQYANDLKWAEEFGFKNPKTLTFKASFAKGSDRLLRLKFDNMKDVTFTSFIPRADALKSLGFVMYLLFASIPLWIAGLFLWNARKLLRRRYSQKDDGLFAKWYQNNWLKLSHPEDEAVNAIAAATKAKIEAAPSDMLQGMFMLLVSIVFAFIFIINGVKLMNGIWPLNKLGFERELINELGYAINRSQDIFAGLSPFTGTDTTGWRAGPLTIFFNDDGGLSILALFIIVGIILLGFTFLGRLFEKLILNPLLKSGINGIVKSSAVTGAFGADTLGETATSCQPHPWEFSETPRGGFPEIVSRAIESHANEDLVELPSKFRAALHKNVSSASDFSLNDLLAGDMGEILLHTSYFSVGEFQDLFAAALVETGDFKPRSTFTNLEIASSWVKDL